MLNIIKYKNWYFLISLLLIIPGIISLFLYGLKLSIDFTGGSRLTLLFPKTVNQQTVGNVRETFEERKIAVSSIQQSGQRLVIRTAPIPQKTSEDILQNLQKNAGDFKQESFETVGPTIGNETTLKAFYAIVLASILIVIYIALSFRKVPKPASSWRFGLCAVVALIHDVLVLLGIFSILGHYLGVEIDSLFVTALLTVIGFSVHDTIVVFDRVRENLLRVSGAPFARLVNDSILQTLSRSLNTSLTAVLVLFTMLIFGGDTLKWFIVALLIGIISGTYSSIFNAAPLLVTWQEFVEKRSKRNH